MENASALEEAGQLATQTDHASEASRQDDNNNSEYQTNTRISPIIVPSGIVNVVPALVEKPLPTARCQACTCLPWASHPLFDAAAEGDADLVYHILMADVALARATVGRKRYSVWHVAAEHNQVEVLKTLVSVITHSQEAHQRLNSSIRRVLSITQSGEQLVRQFLDWRTKSGVTPLVAAARKGRTAAVEYLLNAGADPWLSTYEGASPLHVAAARNHCSRRACHVPTVRPRPRMPWWSDDTCALLVLGCLVIHELCRRNPAYSSRSCGPNVSITKFVDIMDPWGWTPLHHAALWGHVEAVKTLTSHHANLITRTLLHTLKVDMLPSGLTALHLAAFKGNLPLAQTILRAYYETSADLVPSQTAQLSVAERRQRQRRHPDPRLVLTRTARLPYHFAHRLQHSHMLEWLDPSVPLMFLFSGNDTITDASGNAITVGAPRLMVLAATALHKLLDVQLQEAEKALQAHAKKKAECEAAAVKSGAESGAMSPSKTARPSSPTKLLQSILRVGRQRSKSASGVEIGSCHNTDNFYQRCTQGFPDQGGRHHQYDDQAVPGTYQDAPDLNFTLPSPHISLPARSTWSVPAVGSPGPISANNTINSNNHSISPTPVGQTRVSFQHGADHHSQPSDHHVHEEGVPVSDRDLKYKSTFMQRLKTGMSLTSKMAGRAINRPVGSQELRRLGVAIPDSPSTADPPAVATLVTPRPSRNHSSLFMTLGPTRSRPMTLLDSPGLVRGTRADGRLSAHQAGHDMCIHDDLLPASHLPHRTDGHSNPQHTEGARQGSPEQDSHQEVSAEDPNGCVHHGNDDAGSNNQEGGDKIQQRQQRTSEVCTTTTCSAAAAAAVGGHRRSAVSEPGSGIVRNSRHNLISRHATENQQPFVLALVPGQVPDGSHQLGGNEHADQAGATSGQDASPPIQEVDDLAQGSGRHNNLSVSRTHQGICNVPTITLPDTSPSRDRQSHTSREPSPITITHNDSRETQVSSAIMQSQEIEQRTGNAAVRDQHEGHHQHDTHSNTETGQLCEGGVRDGPIGNGLMESLRKQLQQALSQQVHPSAEAVTVAHQPAGNHIAAAVVAVADDAQEAGHFDAGGGQGHTQSGADGLAPQTPTQAWTISTGHENGQNHNRSSKNRSSNPINPESLAALGAREGAVPLLDARIAQKDAEAFKQGGLHDDDGLNLAVKTTALVASGKGVVDGVDSDDGDVCPVCLDEDPNISIAKCGHELCVECAKDLVKRHQLTPALCPFCRIIIPAFIPIFR